MVSFIRLLAQTMDAYGLYDRYEWVANVKNMIDLGLVSEEQARGYLYAMQPCIIDITRRRNFLARAPSLEEMYPDKLPDLIIGELVEKENVPVGLFLHDNMSLIFAGNAGSGKSTALYNLVLAVDQHNKRHPDDFISLIIWETKDGELLAIAETIDSCIVVSTKQTLRVGLQPPVGVRTGEWNNLLGQIISRRGGLQASSISFIERLNFFVSAMNSPPLESGLIYPTFENLYDSSDITQGLFESKEQYRLSEKQVLRQPARCTDDLFKTFRGIDWKKILSAKKDI